jgi:hypothetical protein
MHKGVDCLAEWIIFAMKAVTNATEAKKNGFTIVKQ